MEQDNERCEYHKAIGCKACEALRMGLVAERTALEKERTKPGSGEGLMKIADKQLSRAAAREAGEPDPV